MRTGGGYEMAITIRRKEHGDFVSRPDDGMMVCRCEEVTKGEIRRAVYDGARTFGEVKRRLRTGMGLCQGQTCQRLVLAVISRELRASAGELGKVTGRMPVRPVLMEELSKSDESSKGIEDHV
jgi:bacterioferritin-associated ferredoxin